MNELILTETGSFILAITMSILLVALFLWIIEISKSKKYRRFLTDMYVSAKIRLLADRDGLKIAEEEVSFKDWVKSYKTKSSEYKLDNAIEDDLIEKVEEPIKKAK